MSKSKIVKEHCEKNNISYTDLKLSKPHKEVKLLICKNCDDSLNICVESDGCGSRLVGGKGNGSYSTISEFSVTEKELDSIIKELSKYKKYMKK